LGEVALRQIFDDLTELFLDDVEVVEKPLFGRDEIASILDPALELTVGSEEVFARPTELVEQPRAGGRHRSHPVGFGELTRVRGKPIEREDLTAERLGRAARLQQRDDGRIIPGSPPRTELR